MVEGRRLVRLDRPGLAELKAALRSAGLPADDLREDRVVMFRFEDGDGPIGWATLESCGAEALLRSVVVLPPHRHTGSGSEMVRRVASVARRSGTRRLWLLTETAASFFERLGFRQVDRGAAPASIAATSEFRTTCPASAACMSLTVTPR